MCVPLSSCHLDSVVWLWTETMAGMCVMCFQVWLQTRGPSGEGTDASAAPADWTQIKIPSMIRLSLFKQAENCLVHYVTFTLVTGHSWAWRQNPAKERTLSDPWCQIPLSGLHEVWEKKNFTHNQSRHILISVRHIQNSVPWRSDRNYTVYSTTGVMVLQIHDSICC